VNSCRCEKNWEPKGVACHKKCAICTCQWYIYGNKQGKHNRVWRRQLAIRLTVSVQISIIFPVWFRSKIEVLSGLKIADKQYLHCRPHFPCPLYPPNFQLQGIVCQCLLVSTYYRKDAQDIEGNRRLIFSFGLETGSVFTINYPANAFLHFVRSQRKPSWWGRTWSWNLIWSPPSGCWRITWGKKEREPLTIVSSQRSSGCRATQRWRERCVTPPGTAAKETTSTKTEKWLWTMNVIRLQQSFFQYGSKIVMQTTKLVLDQYSVICFEFQRVCAWTQTSARLFLCSIDAACNQCLWERIYVPGSSGF